MAAKTDIATNLLGRLCRFARRLGPPIKDSPLDKRWDHVGEIVAVYRDKDTPDELLIAILWNDTGEIDVGWGLKNFELGVGTPSAWVDPT